MPSPRKIRRWMMLRIPKSKWTMKNQIMAPRIGGTSSGK